MAMAMIVIMIVTMTMTMTVTVPMTMPVMIAAQQPGAHDIDAEPDHRDRDGFGEMDRNRRQESRDRLIADQHGNHRKHDGAAEARQIAELAGSEDEAARRCAWRRA